ncbi:MAG: C40 family peptidase [Gaiellaceae bacterium]
MSNLRRRSLLVLALAALAGGLHAAPVVAAPGGVGERKRPNGRVLRSAAPSSGERAARIALTAVGTPYRYTGGSPTSGFDCSGLVRWSYGRLGIDLPHSSYALAREGRSVPRSAARPGDVLLFDGLGHVGLYLGAGRMVHAPESGRRVEVVRLDLQRYGARLVGVRRVAPA